MKRTTLIRSKCNARINLLRVHLKRKRPNTENAARMKMRYQIKAREIVHQETHTVDT